MHICLLTSSYHAWGPGMYVRDFGLELMRRGHRVSVFVQDLEPHSPCPDGPELVTFPWRAIDISLADAPMWRIGTVGSAASLLWRGCRAFAAHCRGAHVDRSLALWAVPAGLWARKGWRAAGVPYSVWCLGSDIWRLQEHAIGRALLRRIFKPADHLFADGTQLCRDVERLARRDCTYLHVSRTLPFESATHPPLDPDKTHFLYVGRFHPNKGLDLLVEAIGRMSPAQRATRHFHLVGDGILADSVKARIQTLGLEGCVSLYGYQPAEQVAGFMQACHCLVIPSRIESIPVVLLDALQADLPVIATSVGDMDGLLRKHEVGQLVPPEDIDALGQSMVSFDPDARHRGDSAAVAELFSISLAVDRYLGMIGADPAAGP